MRPALRCVPVLLALLSLAAGCKRQVASDIRADSDVSRAMRAQLGEGGGPAAAAVLPDPTGFANLTGVFRINGAPPSLPAVRVTSDTSVCAQGPSQEVVVGDGNGLSNVFVYLNVDLPADDPRWEHPDFAANRAATLEGRELGFDQEKCVFLAHAFAMRSTQTVQIINSDPVSHNTNIDPPRGAKKANLIIAADSTSLYQPGGQTKQPFRVSCNIHPWMSAWMLIRDNPYFAVTKPDGTFSIANVPAGVELEFRAWQERAGFFGEVTVNGEAAKWSKGRFKLTLEPGSETRLEVTVDAAAFQ